MIIRILGSGCRNCVTLEKEVRAAVAELGIESQIEKVTEYADIAAYGIMSSPGLVVDDQVVSSGKVLRKDEIVKLLQS